MEEERKSKLNESINKYEDVELDQQTTAKKDIQEVEIKTYEDVDNENVKDNSQIEEESKNLLEEEK